MNIHLFITLFIGSRTLLNFTLFFYYISLYIYTFKHLAILLYTIYHHYTERTFYKSILAFGLSRYLCAVRILPQNLAKARKLGGSPASSTNY
ncbi:hypothetical protein EXW50_02835 [Bacillus mycoides]|nr:hypothetical protein EXW26_02830 [Bacillus mycoides]QWG72786.1 hypothetical protein EXW63_11545 [Bacillus mycoides]QWH21402.1 hypothetical protein EXW50_02835 [Bacillus mycoides]